MQQNIAMKYSKTCVPASLAEGCWGWPLSTIWLYIRHPKVKMNTMKNMPIVIPAAKPLDSPVCSGIIGITIRCLFYFIEPWYSLTLVIFADEVSIVAPDGRPVGVCLIGEEGGLHTPIRRGGHSHQETQTRYWNWWNCNENGIGKTIMNRSIFPTPAADRRQFHFTMTKVTHSTILVDFSSKISFETSLRNEPARLMQNVMETSIQLLLMGFCI